MDASGRIRILVVEDESLIAVDLVDLLVEFGYEVCSVVRSADEAVDAARRYRPDLVLTDVQLAHGSSGVDAADRIHAEFGIRSCFISGSIDRDLIEKTRASDPIGFVGKPFQPRVLAAALASAAATRS
jgi:CheY-like chemotaxis protein